MGCSLAGTFLVGTWLQASNRFPGHFEKTDSRRADSNSAHRSNQRLPKPAASSQPLIQIPPPPALTPSPEIPALSPLQGSPIVFKDVSDQHWAHGTIRALSANGLLNGLPNGHFAPEHSMTRAELASQIVAVFEFPTTQEAPDFDDVPSTHWASKAIQKATQMGFLQGNPDDLFEPDQFVTRAQVLSAIASGLNLPTANIHQSALARFEDAFSIPSWAVASVGAASQKGLVVNYPNPRLLEPNREATRAEVAAIMYQALAYLGFLRALPSAYAVAPIYTHETPFGGSSNRYSQN